MTHDWTSPIGEQNAIALRTRYADAYSAIAEADRLGHLLLKRAADTPPVDRESPEEWMTGVGLLRRAVSTFAGTRSLLLAAAVDPAKAMTRVHFESWLYYRALVHGGAPTVAIDIPLDVEGRKKRGRRFRVADLRRGLRTRALLLAFTSPHRAKDEAARDALHKELADELVRVRSQYREEWDEFGEMTEAQLLQTPMTIRDRAWFTSSFPSKKVQSIRQLAHAFGYAWEYDVIYDALSSQVHPRGWSSDLTIEDETVAIHHPHNPDWFAFVCFYSTTWHVMLLLAAARAYAPVMVASLQEFDRRHMPAIRELDLQSVLFHLA